MATIDGYEADPDEVAAILAAELDDEDRADPTLLYVRATALSARHTQLLAELSKLRAQAVARIYRDSPGASYADVGAKLGISRGRVQQFVEAERRARVKKVDLGDTTRGEAP
jgi:DNA-directed RNA polymerase specialized sigma24 family protein